MRWIWTPEKNRTNKIDHGLSFETAALVFDDPLAATRLDPHPDADRWQTVGVVGPITVFVVHTSPEFNGEAGEPVDASSAPAGRPNMKEGLMKRAISNHLTPEQQAELEALAALPEDEIETKDIPEQLDWSGARRGVFFRPIKQQITLRLDADVIDWFRRRPTRGKGYQTAINAALREYVTRHGNE